MKPTTVRRVAEMIWLGHDMLDTANFVHGFDPVFGSEVEENFRQARQKR
jgi:hypothetical protein